MLFSLGKILQSLGDKQEQEESTQPFLAEAAQVSGRKAAPAEGASGTAERTRLRPLPRPGPRSLRLGPRGPAGGSPWVGIPGPLVGIVPWSLRWSHLSLFRLLPQALLSSQGSRRHR